MSPERMYPLLVVLWENSIAEAVRPGVSQGESRPFEVREGSLVEVKPILPGCHCYPPRGQVRVGRGEAVARFWVVPHVLGPVMQARVVVRQKGATLAEVPLKMRVGRQGLTMLTGALGLVLPFALLVLKHFRLDFESQLQEGFGLYAEIANWVVRSLTPEMLGGLLLTATAGLYLVLRPRRRDVFWEVKAAPSPVRPDGQGAPTPPDERARPARRRAPAPPEAQEDLLDRADRAYQARDYRAALALYERALGLRCGRGVHYFRAALAAYNAGEASRALDILRQAETILPASEMRGAMWYNMGCFAARMGRLSEAIRYLHRAVDTGYDDLARFRGDPDLRPLRWHPGFKRLLASLGC
jgi:hypothetical protein